MYRKSLLKLYVGKGRFISIYLNGIDILYYKDGNLIHAKELVTNKLFL